MKFKFRLVEENELEKRAKYHRKRQKGMSPFYSPDGGNVPLNISRFNNSVADGANGLMESKYSDEEKQDIFNRMQDYNNRKYGYKSPYGYQGYTDDMYDLWNEFLDSKPKNSFMKEDFDFNPLKKVVLKAIEYFWNEGFTFPSDKFLSDDWMNLKDGVEIGIDDTTEVAENLVDYMKDLFDDIPDRLFTDTKKYYDAILKYLPGSVPVEYNNRKWSELESLKEDTVKNSDGTWSNKGDEGSHGKFKTKKQADKQRKAMFANCYRESLKEDLGTSQKAQIVLDYYNKGGLCSEHVEDAISTLWPNYLTLYSNINELSEHQLRTVYDYIVDKYQTEIDIYGNDADLPSPAYELFKDSLEFSNNESLQEAGRYERFNPLKEVVIDALDFLWENDYPFPQDRYLADSWYDWKESIETGADDYFEAAQILEDYLGDYASNKDAAFLHDALSDYIGKQLRADKNGGIWESLTEAWFTPLSEVSSFTGWMDDDKLIDEEERFNSKVEKALKTNRNNIQVLIDSDFQYDPRTYEIEDLIQLQEIKTRNIHANKFIVNGIEFVFEDSSSNSSPRLYFKSEEDGEKYTNYIDHYYDEEV